MARPLPLSRSISPARRGLQLTLPLLLFPFSFLLPPAVHANPFGKEMNLEYGPRGLGEYKLGATRKVTGQRMSTPTHPAANAVMPDRVAKNPIAYANRDFTLKGQLRLGEKPDPDGRWRVTRSGIEIIFSDEARAYHERLKADRVIPVYKASLHRKGEGWYIYLTDGIDHGMR